MNYQNPRLIEELAAQYALGTLRGPARRRFERLCRYNISMLHAVHRWEDRLVDLAGNLAPVRPSASVWKNVRQRIRRERSGQQVGAFSWLNRMRWVMAAGVAVLAATVTWWTLVTPTAVPTQLLATVIDQQQAQLWRIETLGDRTQLRVESTNALRADRTRSYELWALSPSGGAPVSLGLMPQDGQSELNLNETQRVALTAARQIAISLEPPGGSPTGAPTGPVLYVAEVVAG